MMIVRLFAALFLSLVALPAQASVTITFWSHEFGDEFPHAFFSLYGVPDAGGQPIDSSFSFTPRAITPAMLFGPVKGEVELNEPAYVRKSDAQFSVVLTDAQYAAVRALIAQWDPAQGGDGTYRLESRNCVHFVKEAARTIGLVAPDLPKLMKKPRSYVLALAAANPQVTRIGLNGGKYLATLPPLVPTIALTAQPVATVPVQPAPAVAAVMPVN